MIALAFLIAYAVRWPARAAWHALGPAPARHEGATEAYADELHAMRGALAGGDK